MVVQDISIKIANTNIEISACFMAMKELRPHLNTDDFLNQVKLQQSEGYTLAYIEDAHAVQAACGFRIATFLAWGKVLYIDDLITREAARGQGFGGALLKWIISRARLQNCNAVHLDTGHHRYDAHRLYLCHGFKIRCHHLSLEFEQEARAIPLF